VDQLRGGTPADNARTALEILSGAGPAAMREAVLLNAGAALYISGFARNIGDGYLAARESLSSGRARAKLDQVRAQAGRTAAAA